MGMLLGDDRMMGDRGVVRGESTVPDRPRPRAERGDPVEGMGGGSVSSGSPVGVPVLLGVIIGRVAGPAEGGDIGKGEGGAEVVGVDAAEIESSEGRSGVEGAVEGVERDGVVGVVAGIWAAGGGGGGRGEGTGGEVKRAVNWNEAPTLSVLSTWVVPPKSSMTALQIDNPRPVPPFTRVVELSAWKNGVKRRPICSFEMPHPLSRTSKRTSWPTSSSRGEPPPKLTWSGFAVIDDILTLLW
jgi:hypothetical protein